MIEGIIEDGILNNTSKVEMAFGFPDSSGLCNILVINKEIYIYLIKKDYFPINVSFSNLFTQAKKKYNIKEKSNII